MIKWENEIAFGLLCFGLLCGGLLWVLNKLSASDDEPPAGGLCP